MSAILASQPLVSHELVVIDGGVENYQDLIAALVPGPAVRVLDPNQDGVQQITAILKECTHRPTLHIVCHGAPGCLYLGNTSLNLTSLDRYASEITSWFVPTPDPDALSPSLLLYSCQVAAGDAGAELIEKLHRLSGARIAASTTPIGSTILGGTWELDYSLGNPVRSFPCDLDHLQAYPGLLAAPTIQDSSSTPRTTPEDAGLTITGLTIADQDNDPQSVTLSATNGILTLASTSGLSGLVGNGTASLSFSGSLADINAALNGLLYTPSLDYSGSASLTLTTNDGFDTASRVVSLAVTAVNDDPLVAPTAVTVNEGGQVTFANANFGITDVDNIATQIILKLVSLPTKGFLTHEGAPVVVGSTFSSDQITQLKYFHNGSQTTAPGGTSDSFIVSIDDGAGGFVANTTIPIAIAPINQAPSLTSSATVFEGQTDFPLPFTITDPDQTQPFTVSPDATNPSTVKILSLPTDGILKVNGVAATVGQILSSADLTQLTYSHDGNDDNGGFPANDSFNVQIIDDGGGTGTPITVNATYAIKVLPNNDDPTLVNNTGVVLNGGTGRSISLNSSHLQVSDPDSSDQQLTYTLTAIPSQGLLLKNGAWMPVGTSFTQADINAGIITYQFSENPGPTGTSDSFTFTVRDSELRTWPSLREGGIYPDATTSTLLPLTFPITIEPTTPAGPGLGADQGSIPPATSSPPTGNVNGGAGIVALGVSLNEAGSVGIDSSRLSVTDADSNPDQVIYRLMGLPRGGVLRLNGRSLNLYDSFSQADINAGLLYFDHGGGEIFDDSFSFTLSDGNSVVTNGGNPFQFALTVRPINDQPDALVTGKPFVKEGETVVIDNTWLKLQDPDGKGELPLVPPNPNFAFVNTLTFQVTTLPQYGRLELNGVEVTLGTVIAEADLNNGKLAYRHNGGEQFSDFFKLQVNDNTDSLGATNNLSVERQVNIDIAKVNDNPFFLSAIDLKVAEGEKGTIWGFGYAAGAAHLIYDDPDNTTIQRQYRITQNVAYGKLTRNGSRLGVGSVFTQDDLDQGRIEYEHDDSENFSDRFEFEVRDGGGAVVPGAYTITVDPAVNDAPVVTVPTQSQRFDTTTPFVFSTANGNAIQITDPDLVDVVPGEVDFIRVTLDLRGGGSTYAAGTLTLATTTGLTVTGNNGTPGGLLVLEGNLAAVQAALNGLSVQVPTDEDRTLQLVVTADDRLNPGNPALLNNGGRDPSTALPGYNIVTKTITINASNSNDAPTIAGPATVAVNEDGSLVFSGGNAIAIGDADDFGSPMTVTLTIPAGTGRLNLPGATGNNTTTVTLTGTKSDINAALQALTYTPTADYNGTLTLTATVDDQGNTGSGGSQTATTTVPITVNPLNDQPLVTVPGQQTISSNLPLSFAAGAIAIDDPKDLPYGAADSFTVTVSAKRESNNAAFGQLQATGQGSASVSGTNTDTLVITGSKADINATLNTLTYTPTNFNIDDRIRITVAVDDGNNGAEGTGSLGEPSTRQASFLVNISEINNPPVLTAPTNPLGVNEDDILTLTGAGNVFSFDDPDDFGATNLVATVTATQGTLSLVSADGTIVSGSGTTTLTLVGSKANLNQALDGLRFTPTPNYHGPAQLTVTINDKGNLGTGGEQTDSRTLSITVNPVNDRPLASGAITLTAATEDIAPPGLTLAALVAANNNYSDTTDNQTGSGGGNTETSLSHVAIVGSTNYVAAQGTWQVSDGSGGWITIPPTGLSATAALVFPASRELRFVPAANFHGTPGSLQVRLADSSTPITASTSTGNTYDLSSNGGTGVTGAWSSGQVTIAIPGVTPINDAPTILNPSTPASLASINEDTVTPPGATVSALLGSKYSDLTDNQSSILGGGNTATPLAGITIIGNGANTATEGTWQYNTGSGWVAIPSTGLSDSAALVIPATAQLRFVPVANYNGTPGGLTVRLSDGTGFVPGSSVNLSGQLGGTNGWSVDTTTLTTTVNPVNDAPLLDNSLDLTLNVNEDPGIPSGAVGVLVSSLTGGISDIDAGAVKGIAVVGIQRGTLWYSLNNGTTWQSAGTPTTTRSRLLAADGQTRLFFRPSTNVNGTIANALTIRAWDQTSGSNGGTANTTTNGGTTAFSSATDTIRITVNPINDAPTRTVASTTLPSSPEDTTTPTVRTVADLFNSTFSDAADNQTALGGSSANTLAGVAIVGNAATAAQGQWQWYNGTTWINVGTRALNSALRLAADTPLRFLPAANYNGTPGSLTVRLIDSSGGAVTAGAVINLSGSATGGTTPYSSSGNAVTLTTAVTPVNDAPLATGTATLTPIDEDPVTVAGDLISALVAANYNDSTDTVSGGSTANPLAGIAIVGNATTSQGAWEYSPDGTTWVPVGNPTPANALLLSAGDRLRFVPAPNYNGPIPLLTAHLIDNSGGAIISGTRLDLSGSSATGGITPYSAATIPIGGTVNPVNDPPVNTVPGAQTVNEDSALTFAGANTLSVNDVDGNLATTRLSVTNGRLTVDLSGGATISSGANGSSSLTLSGSQAQINAALASLSYQGNLNYNGSDTLTIVSTDSASTPLSDTDMVAITVNPVDDPFSDADEVVSVDEDTTLTGSVLTGTSSVDGPVTVTQFTIAGDGTTYSAGQTAIIAGVGTLQINTNGTYTFTPVANYNGAVPVATYTLTDGSGTDDTSTLTITVTPVDDPFTDADETISVNEDAILTGSVLTGTSSVDGPVTVTQFTIAGDGTTYSAGQTAIIAGVGTLQINTNGTYTFTPVANYNGAVPVVTYTLTDGSGTDDTSTLSITVTPVDDPFTDANEVVSVDEDTTLNGSVLTGTSSVDGPVTVTGFTIAGNPINFTAGQTATINGVGSLQILANGDYTFTPVANYSGPVPVVTYTLSDGLGPTVNSTLTLTVKPVNIAPIAVNDTLTASGGTQITITPADLFGADGTGAVNDADIDSASFTSITVTSLATNGYGTLNLNGVAVTAGQVISVTDIANNRLTFTPTVNANGAAIFNYTVSDGSLSSNVATVTINVKPFNIITGVDPNGGISGLSDPDALYGFTGNNIINAGSDTDVVYGGPNIDILNGGSGIDIMISGDGDDILNGGSGNDFMDGGPGNDILNGSSGSDWLVGGAGNDVLQGGRDNDVLIGGSGADTLVGGSGADIFTYKGSQDFGDTIVDFEIVHDRIDLHTIFNGSGSLGNSVQVQQVGLNTQVNVNMGSGFQPLGLLLNVNANTLTNRHFIF